MKMPPDLFKKYQENPMAMDEEVRAKMKVPENRYYTVSMWPENVQGNLYVDMKRFREVKGKKISKSDQK